MKKVLIALAVVAAGVATIPLWGGCDLNAQFCKGVCEVRYFNEDLKAAGCRARCVTDKMGCLADKSSRSVDDFVEGFNN